jgi:glucose 1-dehydrogenase
MWRRIAPARPQGLDCVKRCVMKAITVHPASRQVKILDHKEPKLEKPTDVKVRVLDVGVCGTDKEICQFEYGTPPKGDDYLVLGHECLGEVVETGSDVAGLKSGDLVVPMVRRPCGKPECVACANGRQDYCYTGGFTERGIKEQHGYMTELIVDSARYMNRVPRELRDVGVLVEPLTIAEKGLEQLWKVQQRFPWSGVESGKAASGANAVVLGAGPVGLLGAMALILAGFKTYVYSRAPKPNEKADLVESIGARYVSSKTDSVEQLAEQVGNIDVIYEAIGQSGTSYELMKVLGTNGVFIFTGVPPQHGGGKVDTDLIMRNMVLKNQVVLGTVNAGKSTFEAAIRDLAIFKDRWPAPTKALLTGRFPMEEHGELLLGNPSGIKNCIAIGS